MDRNNYTFDRAFKIIILSVWSLIIAFVFVLSITRTVRIEHYLDIYFEHDSVITNIISIILFAVAAVGTLAIIRHISAHTVAVFRRYSNVIMIVVTFAVAAFYIWWINKFQYYPSGDQLDCMKSAEALINGDVQSWKDGYMSLYPFQNGIVFWNVILLKLFGNKAYIAFQYCNVIFFIIAAAALYRSSEKRNFFTWLALLGYYPIAIYAIYCYGNILGLCLTVLTVAVARRYFDTEKLSFLVATAVMSAFTIIIKTNYSIVIVSILAFMFVDAVCKKRLKSIAGIVAVIICCILFSGIQKEAVHRITGYPVGEGLPKIAWVAMGLQNNQNNWGWWNGWHTYTYDINGKDPDILKSKSEEYIFQDRMPFFIQNPINGITFFSKKLATEWAEPSFECMTIQELKVADEAQELHNSLLYPDNKAMLNIFNIAQTLIYAGLVIFAVSKWRSLDSFNINELIFAVAMIGSFIFYMFWEAKSEYVGAFFYMQIPYSVAGWSWMAKHCVSRIRSITSRKSGSKIDDKELI